MMPLTTVRQVLFLLGLIVSRGLGGRSGSLPWFGSFRMTFAPCAVHAIATDRQSKQTQFRGGWGKVRVLPSELDRVPQTNPSQK